MAEKKRNSNGMGTLSLGKDGYWRGKIQIGTNKETGKKTIKVSVEKAKEMLKMLCANSGSMILKNLKMSYIKQNWVMKQ